MAKSVKSKTSTPLVAVIMGSDSDYRIMKDAVNPFKEFQVPFEAKIVSAHRTPEFMFDYAKNLQETSIKVVVAGAGGAAHLPGMVASLTPLPVIGVPINVTALQGHDALLSIVQMPKGVPVATVAIDNATNAALLAIKILATNDNGLLKKIIQYKNNLSEIVLKKKL